MADEIKNIFVSHTHESDSLVADLKSLMEKAGRDVRDASIDSSKPNDANNEQYIKREILRPRIEWCGAFVVLITPDMRDSSYVRWEVETAAELGKRIVGVFAQNADSEDAPPSLVDYCDVTVGWQGQRVIDAIDGTINGWFDANGTARARRDIKRHGC